MKQIEINEFSRKLIHLLNMIIPLIHIYILKDRMDMLIFLSLMLIFVYLLKLLERKFFLSNFLKSFIFYDERL